MSADARTGAVKEKAKRGGRRGEGVEVWDEVSEAGVGGDRESVEEETSVSLEPCAEKGNSEVSAGVILGVRTLEGERERGVKGADDVWREAILQPRVA